MEKWKNIIGYENIYKISNYGNLLTIKTNKISNGWEHNNLGYRKVRLYKDRKAKDFYIHRLVALHHVDNILNKPHVNHIDFDPKNNKHTNLEWCTHKENIQHSAIAGRMKTKSKELICDSGLEYKSIKEAAEKIGIKPNTLVYRLRRGSKCLNGIKVKNSIRNG